MTTIIIIILAVSISYLIGSLPTSYLFGKYLKKIDIREHGSGNVGATNAYRVIGKIPGVFVLIIDIFKGYIVTGFLAEFFYNIPYSAVDFDWLRAIMGFSVIAGHIWTVFLRFKGGKGIATGAGVLFGISPVSTLIVFIIWLLIFIPTRYISLASVISIAFLPFVLIVLNMSFPLVLLAITICIISTYKHITNIQRLLKGEEHRFGTPNKITRNLFC